MIFFVGRIVPIKTDSSPSTRDNQPSSFIGGMQIVRGSVFKLSPGMNRFIPAAGMGQSFGLFTQGLKNGVGS